MKTNEEKVATFKAWIEGMPIEVSRIGKQWAETTVPTWNWKEFDYRVKLEPVKPVVAYAYRYKRSGNIYWADNENVYTDKLCYDRAPEFDIIAKDVP